jgi:hypothetical protein
LGRTGLYPSARSAAYAPIGTVIETTEQIKLASATTRRGLIAVLPQGENAAKLAMFLRNKHPEFWSKDHQILGLRMISRLVPSSAASEEDY